MLYYARLCPRALLFHSYLVDVMNQERMTGIIASARGARGVLKIAIEYARERKTFGKRLIDHQVNIPSPPLPLFLSLPCFPTLGLLLPSPSAGDSSQDRAHGSQG